MIVLAAALLATAAWVLVPPWRDGRATRMTRHRPADPEQRRVVAMRWRDRLMVGPARRRLRARERVRTLQALGALAAELEAGQPPTQALLAAAGTPPAWPTAVGAATVGDDVAAALRVDGAHHEVLLQLAACWQVAVESGAGLAAAVATVTSAARAAEDVRVQLEAELAGPRATARTLAVLPLVGMAFGAMLGGDPLGWLTGTSAGRICLISGVTLTVIGSWWTGLIAKAVERRL